MSTHLYNLARLTVPGGFLLLSAAPYSLADGTYEQLDTKLNRIEAKSPFYEGSWTVQATRDNIVVPVNIRVKHENSLKQVFTAVKALESALLQQTFELDFRVGDYVVKHTCFAADYSIKTDKPLLFATQALVSAQISTIPN